MRDVLGVRLVHVQHVQVHAPHLLDEARAGTLADAHIGAQDALHLRSAATRVSRRRVDPPAHTHTRTNTHRAGHRTHLLHRVRLLQLLQVFSCQGHHTLPQLVGQRHHALQQHGPERRVRVRRHHVPRRLVERVDLVDLQVHDRGRQHVAQLLHERARLAGLQHHKLALELHGHLEERVAGHVLDARVLLVHELEQLQHHGLQELPVCLEEPWVLANHVPAQRGTADVTSAPSHRRVHHNGRQRT